MCVIVCEGVRVPEDEHASGEVGPGGQQRRAGRAVPAHRSDHRSAQGDTQSISGGLRVCMLQPGTVSDVQQREWGWGGTRL